MGWFLKVNHDLEPENEPFVTKNAGKMGFQAPAEAAKKLEIFT